MVNAEPLRIDWTFARPLRHPDHAVHLDALIGAAAIEEAGVLGPADPRGDEVIAALPFAHHVGDGGWVWCASRLRIGWLEPPYLDPWVRRPDYVRTAEDQGSVWTGRLNSMTPGTGPFRTYFTQVPTHAATHARAWCLGDRDEIERLLGRIRHIGPGRRLGFGLVDGFSVTVDQAAEREWRDRLMPDPAEGYAPVHERLRPPYWAVDDRQVVYAPLEPAVLEVEEDEHDAA